MMKDGNILNFRWIWFFLGIGIVNEFIWGKKIEGILGKIKSLGNGRN
jgi:hypothetical protein